MARDERKGEGAGHAVGFEEPGDGRGGEPDAQADGDARDRGKPEEEIGGEAGGTEGIPGAGGGVALLGEVGEDDAGDEAKCDESGKSPAHQEPRVRRWVWLVVDRGAAGEAVASTAAVGVEVDGAGGAVAGAREAAVDVVAGVGVAVGPG